MEDDRVITDSIVAKRGYVVLHVVRALEVGADVSDLFRHGDDPRKWEVGQQTDVEDYREQARELGLHGLEAHRELPGGFYYRVTGAIPVVEEEF